ncbi:MULTISPECIES: PTS sugar transporter subunit IIA [Lactobacillus]|uniref:PTS Man IIA n=1 Tax=Lactobacillus apis TaxID=303541 RepID=A0A0F4LTF8_9LACO|nr:PTS sugar transporter subunit IIA [Lactobacillus apis]KJY62047.1 PTS Man IIA [Lactobacillus apis]MBH9986498.1 PTS sugar transporter subunit IIA [Lactobacillus sp. M0390]WLS85183.1 PTS sugar transporter subunit IIA [Lactobacillus apis]
MKIILVSHGKLAKGMKDTVEMIAGQQENLEAYEAYENGTSDDSFINDLKKSLASSKNDDVIVVTDVLGGSVNNEATQLLKDHPNLTILTGMNLPLIITLVTTVNSGISDEKVSEAIDEGKKGVLSVNKLMTEEDDEGDLL